MHYNTGMQILHGDPQNKAVSYMMTIVAKRIQLECVAKAQRDGRPAVELIETQVLLIQLWTTAS